VPRTRPPYPEEFRREPISLAQLGDKPQGRLAKDLGILVVHLAELDQAGDARVERPAGLGQDEREKLNRLRDEKQEARRRRSISSAFC
jgi:transposase